MILSYSRFDAELKSIGLLPSISGASSMLTIQIRDPGVNLVAGQQTKMPREDQPLTKMAAAATQGESSVDAVTAIITVMFPW